MYKRKRIYSFFTCLSLILYTGGKAFGGATEIDEGKDSIATALSPAVGAPTRYQPLGQHIGLARADGTLTGAPTRGKGHGKDLSLGKDAGVAKKAVETTPPKPVLPPKLTKSYVTDMEKRSGIKLSDPQKDLLKNELREKKFEKLEEVALKKHRKVYKNPKLQEKIRKEWEGLNGKKWPTTPTKIIKDGRIKIEDRPAQIHHIIPQQYGGPHEAWNAHPLFPTEHQGGIHGSGSALNQILKRTGE